MEKEMTIITFIIVAFIIVGIISSIDRAIKIKEDPEKYGTVIYTWPSRGDTADEQRKLNAFIEEEATKIN